MQEITYDPPITLTPGAYMGVVYEGRMEYWRDGELVATYEQCPDGVCRPARKD
jgi:hypothetical protein